MSEELDTQAEIKALRVELALLRGEAQAEPTIILEGPAEVIRLAKAPAIPEDALLPELKQDLSLDDGFVIQQMIEVLLPKIEAGDESLNYSIAREQVMKLLSLKTGTAKLLWTRRDVHEVFRRTGQLLEREVRRGVERA